MNDLDIPPALAAAVHETAERVPPPFTDLGIVRGRVRRIRRRTTALRTAAAAVLVVALGGSYLAVRDARTASDVADGGPVGDVPIALWQYRSGLPKMTGLGPGIHVPGSSGEIAAQLRTVDGRNKVVDVLRADQRLDAARFAGPAPLPGGGLAEIGYKRRDSLHSDQYVAVTNAAGRTIAFRPAPVTNTFDERPRPMTGNDKTLFRWTSDGSDAGRAVLLAYDIATGRVRLLKPDVGVIGTALPYFGMQANATRIASWPAIGGSTCSADIEDAATGERVATLKPAIADCGDVYFSLSPDNRHAAALVTGSGGHQRVVVVDVPTGTIAKEFELADPNVPDLSRMASGIDWANGTTIRYARGSLDGGDPTLLRLKL